MRKIVIFYREGLFQSVIADSYTFGCILASMYCNYKYLGNKVFYHCFFVLLLFLWVITKGNKSRIFTNKQDLLEYIENDFKE